MFFEEGENIFEEIESMPGQYRMSIDRCDKVIKELLESGVKSVILFGIPKHKDESGSEAYHDHGIVQEAIRYIKKNYPKVYIIGDVCMCEYTSHGHCGILKGNDIDNDSTIKYLAKIALSQVEAGADMVAPSDMMDGRVIEIRKLLDANGYKNIPIMSYSAKYASAFYGPFRVAADSAPAFGDRKTYQMDVHNIREAIKEVYDDVAEGADIVMVKPAMSFLDVVAKVKEITDIPVAAYSVSGEYAMVKSAAKNGFIDEEKIMCEMAVSAFRAGADIYITYYAKELAKCIDKGLIG
jgi:porphobilinogen synthase